MLIKAIAALMSLIMTFSGVSFVSPSAVLDSLSELFFGIPYSQVAVNSSFFDGIDDSDVSEINGNSGFLKDKLLVFLSGDVDFVDKIGIFNQVDGAVIGWCTPLDLYVLSYMPMSYEQITAECEKLGKIEGIDLAIPVLARKIASQKTPDDPFYDDTDVYPVKQDWDELNAEGRNWWLEAINARQAWDYDEYFSQVKTGIIDSGFHLEHPDLQGKISFPDEKTASRNYPDDHGTHVAGIIAAKRNNSTGISGICENSKLICVDWEPELMQFWSTNLAIYFGFSKLVQSGAKVVNLSLGVSSSIMGMNAGFFEKFIETAAYSRSMASLIGKGYDFVVVQSAGNGNYYGIPIDSKENGCFCSITESNAFLLGTGVEADEVLDRIVVVGSADNNYDGTYSQADYSNVGSGIDVSAPGTDIYSISYTYPCDVFSGTSMSAPIVTGVASLIWSVNPDFSGAEVKEILCSSSNITVKPNKDVVALNEENSLGLELTDYKLVNAKLSVEEALVRTHGNLGKASGVLDVAGNEIPSYIGYGENEYTVFSDGSYSFVAEKGSGTAQALDAAGELLYEFEITVE